MKKNLPTIDDLINKDDSSDPLSKGYQVKKKMADLNRSFEEKQATTEAEKLGYAFANLHRFPIDMEALALVPEEEAKKSQAVTFHYDDSLLKLGVVDPRNPLVEEVKKELLKQNYKVKIYMISKSSFEEVMAKYSELIKPKKSATEIIEIKKEELPEIHRQFQNQFKQNKSSYKLEATKMLKNLLGSAVFLGASDIHLEPEKTETKIRFRVDGVLQDIIQAEKRQAELITSRIKILAHLKLNLNTSPQDGSFSVKLDKEAVDIRVSSIPSVHGETLVLRLLVQDKDLNLSDLGLEGLAQERLNQALEKTNGMILTTGPTGSGKTTSLYAILKKLNSPKIKIITIEDPVEYKIEGISQTPIDKAKGLDFATSLRSILRQDPDIVMVGEIRDKETAETAIQAALTGHIMLSTLHTNDAVSTIPRMLDLGIKPFMFTAGLNIAFAQRLVRKLCDNCKHQENPDEKIMNRAEKILAAIPPAAKVEVPEKLEFFTSSGCDQCNNLGYKGRIGIFEAFVITEALEKLILREAPLSSLRQQTIEDGMVTMAQDGILKALKGTTDVYEVFRVTN